MVVAIKPRKASSFGFPLVGNPAFEANYIASQSESNKQCISFFRGEDIEKMANINAGILFVDASLEGKIVDFQSKAVLFCPNPKYEWIKVISDNFENGFEEISDSKTYGASSRISSRAFIESDVLVGENSNIYPFAAVYNGSNIGDNCEIQTGSVVGGIGLGDVWHDGKYHKFVHLGRVILGDNVSIGVNVTVLKGMIEDTVIGAGTKIGSNTSIGHNVKIGKNCYISSGVTIGGACTIEDNCWIAVGVTINDHICMKKNSKAGTGSVIIRDTLENGFYLGNPARMVSTRED